jgi:hypothetical protein
MGVIEFVLREVRDFSVPAQNECRVMEHHYKSKPAAKRGNIQFLGKKACI